MIFTMGAGILLILFSLKLSIVKRNWKPKLKKEKVSPLIVENTPIYPRSDANPQVSQVVPPPVAPVVETPIISPLTTRKRRTTKVTAVK